MPTQLAVCIVLHLCCFIIIRPTLASHIADNNIYYCQLLLIIISNIIIIVLLHGCCTQIDLYPTKTDADTVGYRLTWIRHPCIIIIILLFKTVFPVKQLVASEPGSKFIIIIIIINYYYYYYYYYYIINIILLLLSISGIAQLTIIVVN